MRARGGRTINDAAADGELPVLRQSTTCGGTPGDPECQWSSLNNHDRRAMETRWASAPHPRRSTPPV
jgi:hypothetical protein